MKLWLLLALALGACAPKVAGLPCPPKIQTVQVSVPTPVPCKALQDLGPEPDYPDTDAALAKETSVFNQGKMLLAGRVLRTKRLLAYQAAKVACAF